MHNPNSLNKDFLFSAFVILILAPVMAACGSTDTGPTSQPVVPQPSPGMPTIQPTSRQTVTLTPRPSPTFTPSPTVGPQLARVMLRNGQQKTLKAPLNIAHSMTGMDPCPNLSLDEIKLHNLQQIKLNDNGTAVLNMKKGDRTSRQKGERVLT